MFVIQDYTKYHFKKNYSDCDNCEHGICNSEYINLWIIIIGTITLALEGRVLRFASRFVRFICKTVLSFSMLIEFPMRAPCIFLSQGISAPLSIYTFCMLHSEIPKHDCNMDRPVPPPCCLWVMRLSCHHCRLVGPELSWWAIISP